MADLMFYRRCVDDISFFLNGHQAPTFLDSLNSQHRNLNFTNSKRAYETNLIFDGLHLDLKKLKVILQKSEYSPKVSDKSAEKCISKKIMNMPSETERSKTKENMILQIVFRR